MPKYRDCEPIEPPPYEEPRTFYAAAAADPAGDCTACYATGDRLVNAGLALRHFAAGTIPAARRSYAEAVNINNVRSLDRTKTIRVCSYAGQVMPGGLEYAYGIFSWWYYQTTGRVITWTTGTPDYWITARPNQTWMAGTYRSGAGTKCIANHYSAAWPGWAFDHFMQTPMVHESMHYWDEPGTPGRGSDGHTADRRSIMARSPLGRRVLTKGPDANGLVWGCLPSEVNGIRSVVLSR